ncbi:MAG: short-subunit dehydrogenase [Zhongshania sp.]
MQLQAVIQRSSENNINVLTCDLDMTYFDQWKEVISSAKERFGNVHILVNNAELGDAPSD